MPRVIAADKRIEDTRALLAQSTQQIMAGLPSYFADDRRKLLATRLIRVFRSIAGDPRMNGVTPLSFAKSAVRVAEMGLDPDPILGQVYLVPFKDKTGQMQLNLMVGYRGYLELAWRSGRIKGVCCEPVFKGEPFLYRSGRELVVEHHPDIDADHTGEMPRAVYAMIELVGGGTVGRVLGQAEVLSYRNRSQGYRRALETNRSDNPWMTDQAAMFRKTAIRRVVPLIPQSTEFLAAAMTEDDDADVREKQGTLWGNGQPEITDAEFEDVKPLEPPKGLTLQDFTEAEQQQISDTLKPKGYTRAKAQELMFKFTDKDEFLRMLSEVPDAGGRSETQNV